MAGSLAGRQTSTCLEGSPQPAGSPQALDGLVSTSLSGLYLSSRRQLAVGLGYPVMEPGKSKG